MKIISWNVNGIRAVAKKGFIDWLFSAGADVICLQETKANPKQLSPSLTEPERGGGKFFSHFASAKRPGYSGTAIYCRREPDALRTMGIAEFDDEGRAICADYGDLTIVCAYFPNSQEAGKRLGYKIAFCDAMTAFCNNLVASGRNVVLCGDYNVAHKPIDLANPDDNEGNPGYLPEERAWMDRFLAAGYADTFRHFCDTPGQYTWWSYRTHARERNVGWRLDYFCVNASFLPRVQSSTILSDVQGSDHCPILLETE